jgi:hypothetical protein
MIRHCALIWDEKLVFSRYVEECGVACEHITPHMIATPFYRGRFNTLIVPTGFANPAFSGLLPALKAAAPRIRRFVGQGGRLLVFGAATDRGDAYDWLPVRLRYHHQYGPNILTIDKASPWVSLVEGYDTSCIECDGYFTEFEGSVIASAGGNPVLIRAPFGEGEILATTIHEYPSRPFLAAFCAAPEETLF